MLTATSAIWRGGACRDRGRAAGNGRVALLHEMYPDAKFVHIYRHPYHVYRSNVRLAEQGLVMFQLQDGELGECFQDRFPDNHVRMETAYYRGAANVPEGQNVDVRFEDLERDPIGVIESIYASLNLSMSDRFRQKLEAYVASIADYKKNTFKPLPAAVAERIGPKLPPWLERHGYEAPVMSRETPRPLHSPLSSPQKLALAYQPR